jgi:hypothetical protein
MNDEWTEILRCPRCGKSGMASLSQDMSEDDSTPMVRSVADGFKVVDTGRGPAFHCASCNVEVDP